MGCQMTEQVVWLGIFFDSDPMFISLRLSNVAPSKARPGDPVWNAYQWEVD